MRCAEEARAEIEARTATAVALFGAVAIPAGRYEPPRVEKLGSLRDLLATKTGPGLDPNPHFPFSKR